MGLRVKAILRPPGDQAGEYDDAGEVEEITSGLTALSQVRFDDHDAAEILRVAAAAIGHELYKAGPTLDAADRAQHIQRIARINAIVNLGAFFGPTLATFPGALLRAHLVTFPDAPRSWVMQGV